MFKLIFTAALAGILLSSATAMALDPATKCEASKNKTAGAYYSCREKAEATAITKATMPDYSKCTAKFDDKWDGAETTGAGACPDDVLTAPMNDFIADQAARTAAIIAGTGDLPACGNDLAEDGESCDGSDVNGKTCATEAPSTPYGTLSCAVDCSAFVTAACVTRFDASGDTILDHATGLEWEKKDAEDNAANLGNPHDVDNTYQWSSTGSAPDGGAFTDFLDKLNGNYPGGCYAGHCDWRLPTIEELDGVPWPVLEFQPDVGALYWSASTFADDVSIAWDISTLAGFALPFSAKTNGSFVRAVRSGS